VTEHFDTLSDSTSYDGVLVLWNAPRYPFLPGDKTMRLFLDTVKAGVGGFPDIAAVEAPDGSYTMNPTLGFSQELLATETVADYEMTEVLPAGAGSLGKRFARLRIVFDPTRISTNEDVLLAGNGVTYFGFDAAGAAPLPIADDPNTAGLENTRGNLDTAPAGVPAIAEVRVTFTP
jgi:hypothetical protein